MKMVLIVALRARVFQQTSASTARREMAECRTSQMDGFKIDVRVQLNSLVWKISL